LSGAASLAIGREESLAAVPSLLTLAREVVAAAFEPGDPESDALRAMLEECVVGAHRLCLREQIGAGETTSCERGKP
jgi:hypothetical protein